MCSGGHRASVCGDALGSPVQAVHPDWASMYGQDGPAASRMRRRVLDRLESARIVPLGCHLPVPGHGRVRLEGGELSWVPG